MQPDAETNRKKRMRNYPKSAEDAETTAGEAEDTLEKAIVDIPNVGLWPPSRKSDNERLKEAEDELDEAEKNTEAAEREIRRRKADEARKKAAKK